VTKRRANAERVELDPMRDVRGPRGSDQWKWWWSSIGLLTNRHCAEAHDNDVVSGHLDHVWNTQRHLLPFYVEGD
jgi:hypothetical protein